jgi:hypothetical protein
MIQGHGVKGADEVRETGDHEDASDHDEDPTADAQARADGVLIVELWRPVGHRGENIALPGTDQSPAGDIRGSGGV